MPDQTPIPAAPPSPAKFFETINAFHQTAALKAAIEIELFTAIGEGNSSAATIARRCSSAERGVRILCDFLVVHGFLTKNEIEYRLTPDTAAFLDKRSAAYVGTATGFLLDPMMTSIFAELTESVRRGGTAARDAGTIAPENPVWVKFARAMAPLMAHPAALLAELVDPLANRPIKVLDISAGHGLYGIAFAKRNAQARVVGLDWANVLEVAKENAQRAGMADRYTALPGSAFAVDFESGYDVILLPNFLHHFDASECEGLLKKSRTALNAGGRVAILDFVPNDTRVSPPGAATFALVMLATTPHGDAYTFSELRGMLEHAGFGRASLHPFPGGASSAVIAEK